MTKRRTRRPNFSPAQKIAIVREHLLEKVAISELCERHGMRPNQFYAWQKRLFENGEAAFAVRTESRERELERKIERLQARTREKDEVIAEVARELVLLKKVDGEP